MMFIPILQYELRYWLRQPITYVYAVCLFLAGFIAVSGMAAEATERFGGRVINAPVLLFSMTRRFFIFVILLLPSIVGHAIHRDFSSRMHQLLYVYPIHKTTYVSAKFFSAFGIMTGVLLLLGTGYFVGTLMPWVNPELVQPFRATTYLQHYGLVVMPNLLIGSSLIFGVVLLTRSMTAGFVTALLLFLFPMVAGYFLAGEENVSWAFLFDPMGYKAIRHEVAGWSVQEQNELLLPMRGYIWHNRLVWTTVSVLWLALVAYLSRFDQEGRTFLRRKSEGVRDLAAPTSRIIGFSLPRVKYDFSQARQLTSIWRLSAFEFRHVISSRSFQLLVLAGMVFVLLVMSAANPRWGTETLPRTWQMLELPGQFYSGIINLITFFYAGLLIQRGRSTGMDQLIDINPVSNGVLGLARLLALIKIQVVLLAIVLMGGITVQIWKGYYEFEIGHYLFNLYGLNLIHFVIWAMLALFIQSLFNNFYLGFFLLLMAPLGFIGLAEIGPQHLGLHFLEQPVFRYNQGPGGVFGLRYSEMDGYGPMLPAYFLYKIYWFLAGMLLVIGALLFWKRGLPRPFIERLRLARQRFHLALVVPFVLGLAGFMSLGAFIYHQTNVVQPFRSKPQREALLRAAVKKYKAYENFPQPKITEVHLEVDLFPADRQFKAKGQYVLVNKSASPIDTLIVNYIAGTNCTYEFDRPARVVSKDTILTFGHFDILALADPLLPGEDLRMTFRNFNDPMTILRTNDVVKKHGTLIRDDYFPRLGNWLHYLREEHGMGHPGDPPHPADTTRLFNSYIAPDADRVHFEAKVSTSADQIALAPGNLEQRWEQEGRNYFHYKTKRKIALNYLFASGKYAVATDQWRDVDLEIYYHPGHPYNIRRWMKGMKAGLDYCSQNFGPYQFDHLRTVEFSQTGGVSAHGYPGLIPAGEGAGFIAAVDDSEDGGTDYVFGTAVHEVAHQWWGQQVLPSATLGGKFIVESLAEYTNVMVKKRAKGPDRMRRYLEHSHRAYLKGRLQTRRQESPLIYLSNDQNYAAYPKGAIALYALSEYIGQDRLNVAIRQYVERVAFQEEQYTSSLELLKYIRSAVPDSLQYLVVDLFETVTLYDNRIVAWNATPLANGHYRVDIEFTVSKFRNGRLGQPIYSDNGRDSLLHQPERVRQAIFSLPLRDYVDIGIFGADEEVLYLEQHLIRSIDNGLSVVLADLPTKVALDPHLKLIDRSLEDNYSLVGNLSR